MTNLTNAEQGNELPVEVWYDEQTNQIVYSLNNATNETIMNVDVYQLMPDGTNQTDNFNITDDNVSNFTLVNHSDGLYFVSTTVTDSTNEYNFFWSLCYGADCGNSTNGTFMCDDGTEISMLLVNDGNDDCAGGEDEFDDSGEHNGTFMCDDGTEISMSLVDDGNDDCAGGEDEFGDSGEGGEGDGFGDSEDVFMDIYFEQLNDSYGEMMLVSSAGMPASVFSMFELFIGDGDGVWTAEEVEFLQMMMSEDDDDMGDEDDEGNESMEDDDVGEDDSEFPLFTLNGIEGIESAGEMSIHGLIEGDDYVYMEMVTYIGFAMDPYDSLDTLTLVVSEIDDSDNMSEDESDGDEICELWVHNGNTWTVDSITDSASMMNWSYDYMNDAWMNGESCDSSGNVTFVMSKTENGAMPEDGQGDWGEIDTNLIPDCSVMWYSISEDGQFEFGQSIERAPSGDHEIDLEVGVEYGFGFFCIDPEGSDLTLNVNSAYGNVSNQSQGVASGFMNFTIPTGVNGPISLEFEWSDGHHNESGTVVANFESVTIADTDEEAGGALPGFTSAMGVVALLGAAMLAGRRKE